MRRVRATDAGILPLRDNWVEWGALLSDVAAHYAATGEPTAIELEPLAEYWTQHHAGSGAIYAGTGWQMVSGLHIEGRGALVRNLPASEGGRPGQVLGVINQRDPVQDIGLRGLRVLNDTGLQSFGHHHAMWFHSTRGPISGIRIEDVHVLGSTSGDGAYFGTQCSDVQWSGGSVNGCRRHSVTLAGIGAGRSGYRIEGLFMGAPSGGSAFHIECEAEHEAAYALLATDPNASPEAVADALQCIRDIELRRCFFEGNATFNAVSDWRVIECGSRPRDGAHGGSLVATNAPAGLVRNSTIRARERAYNNAARAVTLIGAATSVAFEDVAIVAHACLDGSTPPVVYSRQYRSATMPGFPRGVAWSGCIATHADTADLIVTEGPGWDTSGLVSATWAHQPPSGPTEEPGQDDLVDP